MRSAATFLSEVESTCVASHTHSDDLISIDVWQHRVGFEV